MVEAPALRNCIFCICIEGVILSLMVKSSVEIRIEYLSHESVVTTLHERILTHYKQISEFEICLSIGSKKASWKNLTVTRHLGRDDVAI